MNKWMSRIPDQKKIVLINIPGTHDSCAFYMNRLGADFSTTQFHNIKEQLEIGIRRLDIRITSRNQFYETDEDIITCHGICDCYVSSKFGDMRKVTYKSVVLDVKEFLEINPTETVIMATYKGRGDIKHLTRGAEIFFKYAGNIALRYNDNITLGEARGKIIFITEYIDTEKDLKDFKPVKPVNINIIKETGIDEVHQRYYDCPTYAINGNAKIVELNDMFKKYNLTLNQAEIAEKNKIFTFPISYSVSCTGEHDVCCPFPITQANYVNNYLLEFGVLRKGNYYGWIKFDFANTEVVSRFVDTNFLYY